MKKINKKISVLLLATIMLLNLFPCNCSYAKSKVKLNVNSKTLKVGQTAKIKLLNNKDKVKWATTGNGIVIKKSTNKYAKIKAYSQGKAYLKAKIGKKIYKCKIIIKPKTKHSSSSMPTPAPTPQVSTADITYQDYNTKNGVVCIFRNNGSSTIDLTVNIVYFRNGLMIGSSSESNYAFESGSECILRFSPPYDINYNKVHYDNYLITLNAEYASNIISRQKYISVNADMSENNVTAEITNNSDVDLAFIVVAIVWYNQVGNPVGHEYTYAHCEKIGTTDYITFDFPFDENLNTIMPASYKIYVNEAYNYSWNI